MSHEKLKTLHLFAGAGGGLLADLILGHEPVCAVEWDAYCCQVLRERAAEGWFPGLQVWEGDVRLFPASDWKGRVDCLSAGFPCQPHSVAGKRKGADDDRNLWPQVVRCIGEIRPRWVFLENVPGLVSNGFIGTVLRDLAGLGYDARWTLLGADQVGAPHRRDRWWCLAYARGEGLEGGEQRQAFNEGGAGPHEPAAKFCEDVPNTKLNAERGAQEPKGHRKHNSIGHDGNTVGDDVGNPRENVAHATGREVNERERGVLDKTARRGEGLDPAAVPGGEDVAHPRSIGLERPEFFRDKQANWNDKQSFACNEGWWSVEPDLGGMVDELASFINGDKT